jgi:CHAD domain-containing protein
LTVPATVGNLALVVIRHNATAFRDRIDGVRAGEDIEEVHQMRVATRRLRGALRVFGDILPPEAGTLHEELSWIADRLAPARDLDVQLERLSRTANELGLDAALIRPYRSWLEAERRNVQAALDDALTSTRFERLLQLMESQHDWTTQPTISEGDGPRRLRRAYKRLKRRAGRLEPNSSPADLHTVCIRAKWLHG